MKGASLNLVLILGLAVVLTSLVTLQGQNTAAPRPVTVAVVDMEQIFNRLEEKKSVEADLRHRSEMLQQEVQKRTQAIEGQRTDLQVLRPGSTAYDEAEEKIIRDTISLDSYTKFQQSKLRREEVLQMKSLYRRVAEAIGREAEKRGYDLVLYRDSSAELPGSNEQQVAAMINMRKVIFAAPKLDITDQIIQILNNEFNNRGPSR